MNNPKIPSRSSIVARAGGWMLVTLTAVALLSAHCNASTLEGDRCNPALSHNECAGDPTIQCVTPPNCVDSFCCGPSSTSPNCQACPVTTDGGDDGGGGTGDDGGGETGPEGAAGDAAPE
jgi:hypothetical protein